MLRWDRRLSNTKQIRIAGRGPRDSEFTYQETSKNDESEPEVRYDVGRVQGAGTAAAACSRAQRVCRSCLTAQTNSQPLCHLLPPGSAANRRCTKTAIITGAPIALSRGHYAT